jgi:hypothetical protein
MKLIEYQFDISIFRENEVEKMRLYNLALVVAVSIFVALSMASSVSALPLFDYPWTIVGSAGTVDEGDVSIYEVSGPNIYIKADAPLPANLVVRYNVVAVGQLLELNVPAMKVRYIDNGKNASVTLKLKEVNLDTGVQTTMLSFNSNDFTQSNLYQTRSVYDCNEKKFDFQNNAYYIEAKLARKNTSELSVGVPGLQAIQVTSTKCGLI